MSTFLNIIHLIISFFGAIFLGYLLFKIWQANKWRLKPKTYRKQVEVRKAESRLQAKANGKRKFDFKYKDRKIRIWAKSRKEAGRRFSQLTEKERSKTFEIFE